MTAEVKTWDPLRSPASTFVYIDLSSIDQDRKVISGSRLVNTADAPSRARQLLQTGDVLVSTVRPNLNGVARVSEDHDGATASTGFTVVRPGRNLDTSYLFHWVRSPLFVADMVAKATGASYPAISDRIVYDSIIPLPPIEEQRRIAAILDQADALRAKRHEALTLLDTLAQSIFVAMFGDPLKNQMNWPVRSLGALVLQS